MKNAIVVKHGERIKRVWNIKITEGKDRAKLNTALFSTNSTVNRFVTEAGISLYKHMNSGNRPCHLVISVYEPLTDQQANNLNNHSAENAANVSNFTGTIVGGTVGFLNKPVGLAAGIAARKITLDSMLKMRRNWNYGDLLIIVDGTVNGGIGQPHSIRHTVLERSKYDSHVIEI
jgi:hypothetical protein